MIREFRLSPPGRGVSCDANGAFVGCVSLLQKVEIHGGDRWEPRDCELLSDEIGLEFGLPIDVSGKSCGLKAICNALNEGDVARAQIATVLLGIPEPPDLAKSARAEHDMIDFIRDLHWSGMIKANWDPDKHPRWPAGAPESQGGRFAPIWEALRAVFAEIGREQIAETNANIAVANAEVKAVAEGLKEYSNFREQKWREANGDPTPVSIYRNPTAEIDGHEQVRDVAGIFWHETFDPKGPLVRPAKNGDWIDPLVDLASTGAMVAGPFARLPSVAVKSLDRVVVSAADSEILIGNSGFRGIGEFSDAVAAKYQALYDEGYANTMEAAAQGLLPNESVVIGRKTDALARAGLRDWLNSQQISEGSGEIIRVNRRLYDPAGSGDYRIPDVYIPNSQTILDGSLQFKTGGMAQISDFKLFSRGAEVIIIRPSSSPDGWATGSYGIVY